MEKNIVYLKQVKEMIKRKNKEDYSHVLICYDKTYDYYFPRYVTYFESVQSVIEKTVQMSDEQRIYILEVYNYNLNIEEQLNEKRACNIIPIVKKHIVEKNLKLALDFATKMHDGQLRKDGTPYIMHPVRVARNVKNFKDSKRIEMLMMCAYLHDTVEDTDVSIFDIEKNFGEEVAQIVNEVTNDNKKKNEMGKEKYLSKKMEYMSSWALVVKLCDRLDNVSDLTTAGEIFRLKYMNETLGIITYIIYRRELSNTHLTIIKEILKQLQVVNNLFNYNDERVDELLLKVEEILLERTDKEKKLIYSQNIYE